MRFTIPGPPVIQERPRAGKFGQFYDPTANAKKRLGYALLNARQGAKFKILGGDIDITVKFYGMPHADLDNAIKALLDAANGILWEDDRQVVHIDAWKYSSKEGDERTEVELSG